MKAEKRALADLTPDPNNARSRGPRAVLAIAESMDAFGQQKPIVVDAQGTILAGNGRYAAAQHLGWQSMDCVVLESDDPDEAKAYAIADNRTAEMSGWDASAVTAAYDAASERHREAMGFTADAIEQLRGLAADTLDEFEDLDDQGPAAEQAAEPMRSIVLTFGEDAYDDVVAALAELREAWGVDSNSAALVALATDGAQ